MALIIKGKSGGGGGGGSTPPSLELLFDTTDLALDTSPYPKIASSISATRDTTIFKNGNSSASFNGTSQDIRFNSSQRDEFWFHTNDFTIEAWIYPTNVASQNTIASKHGTSGYSWMLVYAEQWIWAKNGIYYGSALAFYPPNQWTHLALVCQNQIVKLYLNGTAAHTFSTVPTGSYNANNQEVCLGINPDAGGVWRFAGKIDDFRIIRAAKYTSNFTPV